MVMANDVSGDIIIFQFTGKKRETLIIDKTKTFQNKIILPFNHSHFLIRIAKKNVVVKVLLQNGLEELPNGAVEMSDTLQMFFHTFLGLVGFSVLFFEIHMPRQDFFEIRLL